MENSKPAFIDAHVLDYSGNYGWVYIQKPTRNLVLIGVRKDIYDDLVQKYSIETSKGVSNSKSAKIPEYSLLAEKVLVFDKFPEIVRALYSINKNLVETLNLWIK